MNLFTGRNLNNDECIFDVHSFATELDEDTLRTKVNGGCCDASAPNAPPSPPSGNNTPKAPAITETYQTTNPGTSPTTNTPNPSDPSNPGPGYTGGGYEPPPEVMSNPQAYGYWKALQDLAKQQGDPDRYKDYNVLGDHSKKLPSNLRDRGNIKDRGFPSTTNGYNPSLKKDTSGEKKALMDRLYFDLDLQKHVKENTKVVITRSPSDNGRNGQYYKSTVEIQYGDLTLFEGNIQSTADGKGKNMGKTIPKGDYTGYLLNRSGSYLNPIALENESLGVDKDNGNLIHPDAFTAKGSTKSYGNKPCSLGCQISQLSTFGEFTSNLKNLGFDYGSNLDLNSSSNPAKGSWKTGDVISVTIQ